MQPARRLTGKLDTPARWQNDTRTLDLPTLAGKLNFAPRRAGTPVKIAVQAGGRLDFGRDSAAGKLDLRADDSRIQGSWSLSRLASPSVGFDLDVDRLDLDRYLGDGAGRKSKADDGAAPLDLSALTGADLDGVLRIASLKAGGLRLERLRLPLSRCRHPPSPRRPRRPSRRPANPAARAAAARPPPRPRRRRR